MSDTLKKALQEAQADHQFFLKHEGPVEENYQLIRELILDAGPRYATCVSTLDGMRGVLEKYQKVLEMGSQA